jgi:hypothetical protein
MSQGLTDAQKDFKLIYDKLITEVNGNESKWKGMLKKKFYFL